MTLPSRGRSHGLSLSAVALLLSLPLLLTACGDDSDDGGSSGGAGADDVADIDTAEEVPALQGESCDAEIALTGAVEQTFSGEGTVATSEADVAPPASYQAQFDDVLVTALSGGNGFDPGFLVMVGAESYGVPTGTPGLDIAEDGSGLQVEAEAGSISGGDPVQVVATFAC